MKVREKSDKRRSPSKRSVLYGSALLGGVCAWALLRALAGWMESTHADLTVVASFVTLVIGLGIIRDRLRRHDGSDPLVVMTAALLVYTVPLQLEYAISATSTGYFEIAPLPIVFTAEELLRATGFVLLAMAAIAVAALARPVASRTRLRGSGATQASEVWNSAIDLGPGVPYVLLLLAVLGYAAIIVIYGTGEVLGSTRAELHQIAGVNLVRTLCAVFTSSAFVAAFLQRHGGRSVRSSTRAMGLALGLSVTANLAVGDRRFLVYLLITYLILAFRYGRIYVSRPVLVVAASIYVVMALVGQTRHIYPEIVGGSSTPIDLVRYVRDNAGVDWLLPSANEMRSPYTTLLLVARNDVAFGPPWSTYLGSLTHPLPAAMHLGSEPPSLTVAREIARMFPGVFPDGAGFGFLAVGEAQAAGGASGVLVVFAGLAALLRFAAVAIRRSKRVFIGYAIIGPQILTFVRAGSSPISEIAIWSMVVGIVLLYGRRARSPFGRLQVSKASTARLREAERFSGAGGAI
ncbi:MAG: hypothetical protein ACRDTE_00715 [Pseudonocardiaceae bacterium]